jgi:hypothetical protein
MYTGLKPVYIGIRVPPIEMEDEKRLFSEKLDEYESKLPQKYDREKFVLSSEKYNLILECLSTKKGIKAPGGESP